MPVACINVAAGQNQDLRFKLQRRAHENEEFYSNDLKRHRQSSQSYAFWKAEKPTMRKQIDKVFLAGEAAVHCQVILKWRSYLQTSICL